MFYYGVDMKEYKNKTILLTGASTGIGYAMAHLLADQGANLIITARGRDKLEDLAKELSDKNIQTHIFTQDISEANSAKKLFDQIEQANLSVDLLINNAGYGRWAECNITNGTKLSLCKKNG